MQLDNQIVFFTLKRMEASMRHFRSRATILLHQRTHSIYKFLKENGFFEEIVRGIVKFIFFVIILYCFKQVVW